MSAQESEPANTPTVDVLFATLASALIAWAAVRIPPALRPAISAEDVAQEVWLRAVRLYPESFDPRRSSARAWLFAVAKNVLLEAKRKARQVRERAPGGTTRLLVLAEVPASITSITSRASRDEEVQRFVARVEGLPAEDRMLLLHCGIEDMTLAEAAQRLGIGLEAASKRWQRLRRAIAQWPASCGLLA